MTFFPSYIGAQSICTHYSSLSGQPDIFLGSGTGKKSGPKKYRVEKPDYKDKAIEENKMVGSTHRWLRWKLGKDTGTHIIDHLLPNDCLENHYYNSIVSDSTTSSSTEGSGYRNHCTIISTDVEDSKLAGEKLVAATLTNGYSIRPSHATKFKHHKLPEKARVRHLLQEMKNKVTSHLINFMTVQWK